MSLDVYLEVDELVSKVGSGIWVRENGQQREISWVEWNARYPDRAPVIVETEEDSTVFTANITHNLNKMASEAGLYDCVWRPEENGYEFAHQLITPLRIGLDKLVTQPEYYKQWNPENRWGTYEGLVKFVREYLVACKANPDARIRVSR